MESTCAVVLAAGDGKRMLSARPKVLCEVLFKPMLAWVLESSCRAGVDDICVVISENAEEIETMLPQLCPSGFATAIQRERKGTGHAVGMARDFLRLRKKKNVLLLCGDAPFVDEKTIEGAFLRHVAEGNAVTVVAAQLADPTGYGRIVTEDGALKAIVEDRDADEAVRAIGVVNAGVYWFDCGFLLEALEELKPDNAQGEYYLTDTVSYGVKSARPVGVYFSDNPEVALGANDRRGLALLNQVARERVLHKLYAKGVDIPLSDGVLIGDQVEIGADTRILPGTILKGHTVIGKNCVIGPNTTVTDCVIEDQVLLDSSSLEKSRVERGAKIGPFARVRPGSRIGRDAKIGNFVEIKNSVIGPGTSVAHLSYLGDSDLGAGVNVGCGVVTANYDGARKLRTTVGDGVFIGCNTNLIAPVEVGARSSIAAGTTVTDSVPENALAIGRVRQQNKEGWTLEKGKYKKR